MKLNNILSITVVGFILFLIAGCKKNETPGAPAWQQYQLASLNDSTGMSQASFSYDAQGRLIKFYSGTSLSYDFYYSGNTLIARTYTSGGTLTNVDSFFYDNAGRINEVFDYNGSNVKQDSVLFAYNGDNTVHSAIVGNISGATANTLHEYAYANGQLASRTDFTQQANGDFVKTSYSQMLGYDSNPNLLYGIYQKYLPDQFNFFFFVWAGPDNCTSIQQTNYDATTGFINALYSATIIYNYNSNTLPVRMVIDEANTSLIYTFQYQHI